MYIQPWILGGILIFCIASILIILSLGYLQTKRYNSMFPENPYIFLGVCIAIGIFGIFCLYKIFSGHDFGEKPFDITTTTRFDY